MDDLLEQVYYFMDTAAPFPGGKHGFDAVVFTIRLSYLDYSGCFLIIPTYFGAATKIAFALSFNQANIVK